MGQVTEKKRLLRNSNTLVRSTGDPRGKEMGLSLSKINKVKDGKAESVKEQEEDEGENQEYFREDSHTSIIPKSGSKEKINVIEPTQSMVMDDSHSPKVECEWECDEGCNVKEVNTGKDVQYRQTDEELTGDGLKNTVSTIDTPEDGREDQQKEQKEKILEGQLDWTKEGNITSKINFKIGTIENKKQLNESDVRLSSLSLAKSSLSSYEAFSSDLDQTIRAYQAEKRTDRGGVTTENETRTGRSKRQWGSDNENKNSFTSLREINADGKKKRFVRHHSERRIRTSQRRRSSHSGVINSDIVEVKSNRCEEQKSTNVTGNKIERQNSQKLVNQSEELDNQIQMDDGQSINIRSSKRYQVIEMENSNFVHLGDRYVVNAVTIINGAPFIVSNSNVINISPEQQQSSILSNQEQASKLIYSCLKVLLMLIIIVLVLFVLVSVIKHENICSCFRDSCVQCLAYYVNNSIYVGPGGLDYYYTPNSKQQTNVTTDVTF